MPPGQIVIGGGAFREYGRIVEGPIGAALFLRFQDADSGVIIRSLLWIRHSLTQLQQAAGGNIARRVIFDFRFKRLPEIAAGDIIIDGLVDEIMGHALGVVQVFLLSGIRELNYASLTPIRSEKFSMAKQKRSNGVNPIRDGSPSRILKVRRISLGMTTRPSSSIRLTMPVALTVVRASLLSSAIGFPWKRELCEWLQREDLERTAALYPTPV